jgi:hypothetical protein
MAIEKALAAAWSAVSSTRIRALRVSIVAARVKGGFLRLLRAGWAELPLRGGFAGCSPAGVALRAPKRH